MVEHDLAFLLDLLQVDGEAEDALDHRLKAEAREWGVDMAHGYGNSTAFGMHSSRDSRRSESLDSRTSHSTGLTSTLSECSKDHTSQDAHQPRSRASLSFRDYDSFVCKSLAPSRKSTSSLASSTRRSIFSSSHSQPTSPDLSPRKHLRKIRGISLLRLHHRSNSADLDSRCPHCARDSLRRAVHRLPCGHCLCTQALRMQITRAMDSHTEAVPSCCERPIPGSLVQCVMSEGEQSVLLEKLEQWDAASSANTSMASSRRNSAQQAPAGTCPHRVSNTLSDDSSIAPSYLESHETLARAMARQDYKLLQLGQAEQRDRLLTWAATQMEELNAKHEALRKVMAATHETAAEEMQEHHASATAGAEDKQVKAESELREAHEKEWRDNATALKHMEAYCAGTYGNGEPHERPITGQDLAELEKARWSRDTMQVRHESAINVLRGEQNRRLRLRALRQERELQDLKRQQRKEELELERTCSSERAMFHENMDQKRRKIRWRWELQMAILAKKIEAETSTHLECRLPTADWPRDLSKQPRECLSTPKVAHADDAYHMLTRHDSTTTRADVVVHDANAKHDALVPTFIIQEFKLGF